jgi:ribosomal-protein-alanine N-acetyltransferase
MYEAMNLLIKYGFDTIKLHSIEANINPNNTNSRNVLIKNKFKKEAYYRENYYFNGQYLDSEIYSLLASDLESDISK